MVEFLNVTLQTLLIVQGSYLGSWGEKIAVSTMKYNNTYWADNVTIN